MCILLSTTRHPDFPFILLSNRDEYFRRPTQPAHFRSLNGNAKIISPLDLGRPEHGTWIGVTTTGKIAVLVNYRENGNAHSISEVSRGVLPLAYLKSDMSDDEWHASLESSLSKNSKNRIELNKIGGFTLVYGQLKVNPVTKGIDHLNILSNRGDHGKIYVSNGSATKGLHEDVSYKSTFGLSNSLYYHPWNKVKLGESLLNELIDKAEKQKFSQEDFVEECFRILSYDTFNKEIANQDDFGKKLLELRNSIFIPPLITDIIPCSVNTTVGKFYGTRTQTVILLDRFGNLNYFERDVHNSDNLNDNLTVKTQKYKFNIAEE